MVWQKILFEEFQIDGLVQSNLWYLKGIVLVILHLDVASRLQSIFV